MGIPTPPPQPCHLQSPTPHCYAPLREMGTPSGPEGQSWVSPEHPAMLGRGGQGRGLGKPVSPPPHASSASALHPGATPPPWCLSAQRGTTVCTFISPKNGHSQGGALQLGPQKDCNSCDSGRGGEFWRRGRQRLWAPVLHRGLPSAKRFPLSRSRNTKLGTTGTPLPRLPSPIPAPTPGWPSWVGGLGGSVRCSRVTRPKHRDPSQPIHLSPHWPPLASTPGAEEYVPHHDPYPRPRPKLLP